MNEKDFDERLAKSLRRMGRDYESRRTIATAKMLMQEADRLTAEDKPAFEGVKYVVVPGWGDPLQLITREEFLQKAPESRGLADRPGAIFIITPDGMAMCSAKPGTPWHPEVGDEVALEEEPGRVYTLAAIRSETKGHPYGLDPGDGSAWYYYPLSDLRPISFAEQAAPEPEKQEFEEGELVANCDGAVGIVLGNGRLGHLADSSSSPAQDEWHIATKAEVAAWCRTYPCLTFDAFREHARRKAQEAK